MQADGIVISDFGNRTPEGICECLNPNCRSHAVLRNGCPCDKGEIIFCGFCAEDKSRPCRHLGEATSERRVCETCRGRTQIKVFECDVFGRCSTFKDVGLPVCYNSCKRYEPLAS